MTKKKTSPPEPIKVGKKVCIGWREWIALPGLDVHHIKAKIDTGARTSALHAWAIKPFHQNGRLWVSFEVHPRQRSNIERIQCQAPVADQRSVKSSSGHEEARYVIETALALGGQTRPIEITLTNRDEMGFRLLLGRAALKGRYLVDPGKSYLLSRKPTLR